jgi:hypothetical protein
MTNVIDFSKYMKEKSSIVNRVLVSPYFIESIAASDLESELKRVGLRNTKVFHQENNYVVILDCDLVSYWKLLFALRFFYRKPATDVLFDLVRKVNSRARELVVFRRWPSRKVSRALLTRWGINPDL